MNTEFTYLEGGVTAPKSFKAAGVKARIKYDRKDLAVIFSEAPANAAGVFTTNRVKAAPVTLSESNLSDGTARAIVVNSGCANACTGPAGMEAARRMAEETASRLGIDASDVVVASTGVIGQELPMDRVVAGIEEAVAGLSDKGGHDVALAIMTTDTFHKEIAVSFELGGRTVTIGGTAKGSGMIHPNMATMLSFVTTDVSIEPVLLKKALTHVVNRSFNMVTVDGDTSTNDSLVVIANGAAGNPRITVEDDNYLLFREAFAEVCVNLARMIARDGEGATKVVEVTVRKAASFEEAKQVAMAVANSNLVKTAIFGEDANWGRIICAVGYSGVNVDPDKIDIYLGDEKMAENGGGLKFSEERAKEILSQDTVAIIIELNQGEAEATAWTCDFSYDYVKINADYRT